MKVLLLFSFAAVGCMLIASCGGGGGSQSEFARLSVISDFQSPTRTVPGYADSLRVTITPPNGIALPNSFPNPFILTRGSTSRTLDELVPSGNSYLLHMEALTNNTVVGVADRSVQVSSGTIREIDVSANLQSEIDHIEIDGTDSLTSQSTVLYSAHAENSSGATLFSGAGFSWTSSNPGVLSIDSLTGNASAVLQGQVTISATLIGSTIIANKHLIVTSSGGVSVVVSPSILTLAPGESHNFIADVTGIGNTDVAWSVVPGSVAGTISNSGSYTAPATPGTYFVQATSLGDPNSSGDAMITVSGDAYDDVIVFNSSFDQNDNIWTVSLDGLTFRRLTDNIASEVLPEISPSGTMITYTSPPTGTVVSQIFTKDLITGTEVQRTFGPQNANFSTWSPDGSKLLFARGTPLQIQQLDISNNSVTPLTSEVFDCIPIRWSPNGQKILLFSPSINRYFTMNANGTGLDQIGNFFASFGGGAWTSDSAEVLIIDRTGGTTALTIDPTTDVISNSMFWDNTTFAFTTFDLMPSTDFLIVGLQNPNDIFLYSWDGVHVRRITDRTGNALNPKFGRIRR